MGRHGFPGIPRRSGMKLPSCNGLREASALMRISSKYYLFIHVRMSVCNFVYSRDLGGQ